MMGQGKNRGPDWSKDDDARLRREWEAGTHAKELVAVFNRGHAAIRARAHRLGLVRPVREAAPKPVTPKAERKHPLQPNLMKPQLMRFGAIAIPKRIVPLHPGAPERLICEPVTLEDRRRDQCGWPVNDGGPYLFCGAPRRRKYCAYHNWLASPRTARMAS